MFTVSQQGKDIDCLVILIGKCVKIMLRYFYFKKLRVSVRNQFTSEKLVTSFCSEIFRPLAEWILNTYLFLKRKVLISNSKKKKKYLQRKMLCHIVAYLLLLSKERLQGPFQKYLSSPCSNRFRRPCNPMSTREGTLSPLGRSKCPPRIFRPCDASEWYVLYFLN